MCPEQTQWNNKSIRGSDQLHVESCSYPSDVFLFRMPKMLMIDNRCLCLISGRDCDEESIRWRNKRCNKITFFCKFKLWNFSMISGEKSPNAAFYNFLWYKNCSFNKWIFTAVTLIFQTRFQRLRHLYLTIYYVSVRYASKRWRAPMLIPAPLNGFTYSCFATKMDLHKFSLDTSKSSIADCLTSETARLMVQDFFYLHVGILLMARSGAISTSRRIPSV